MISLEGVVGSRGRGGRGGRGVRVLAPASRLARPLLLTSAKPLHNIILQVLYSMYIKTFGSRRLNLNETKHKVITHKKNIVYIYVKGKIVKGVLDNLLVSSQFTSSPTNIE